MYTSKQIDDLINHYLNKGGEVFQNLKMAFLGHGHFGIMG